MSCISSWIYWLCVVVRYPVATSSDKEIQVWLESWTVTMWGQVQTWQFCFWLDGVGTEDVAEEVSAKGDFLFFLAGHSTKSKGMLITLDIYRVSYSNMVHK